MSDTINNTIIIFVALLFNPLLTVAVVVVVYMDLVDMDVVEMIIFNGTLTKDLTRKFKAFLFDSIRHSQFSSVTLTIAVIRFTTSNRYSCISFRNAA
jgi:hypothetical protein